MLLSKADSFACALDCLLRGEVSAKLSLLHYQSPPPPNYLSPFWFRFFKINRWEFNTYNFLCFDEAISWLYFKWIKLVALIYYFSMIKLELYTKLTEVL